MIKLTRFPNGDRIAFNPDLIERAEQNPDTVITLTDGTRYIVTETVDEIIDIIERYRARVLALAHHLAVDPGEAEPGHLRLVRNAVSPGPVRVVPAGKPATAPEDRRP